MIEQLLNFKSVEYFEKILNYLIQPPKHYSIATPFTPQSQDLCKLRKTSNELLILTTYKSTDESLPNISILHLFKINRINKITQHLASEEYLQKFLSKLHRTRIGFEVEKEEEFDINDFYERFELVFPNNEDSDDPLDDELTKFVPSEFLLSLSEETFVAFNSKIITTGEILWTRKSSKLRYELQTIPINIVGQIYSTQSPHNYSKVMFHHLSSSIICALTNENIFQIYDSKKNMEDPCLSFFLRIPKTKKGKNTPHHLESERIISFDFGANIMFGWQKFAIYFMSESGAIYMMCPVLIPEFLIDNEYLENLNTENQNQKSKYKIHFENFLSLINQNKSFWNYKQSSVQIGDLSAFYKYTKPSLQGPIQVISYSDKKEESSKDENYTNFCSLDFYPSIFLRTNSGGFVDILVNFQGAKPRVEQIGELSYSRTLKLEPKKCSCGMFLFKKLCLTKKNKYENSPELHIVSKAATSFYLHFNSNLYEVLLPWISELERIVFDEDEEADLSKLPTSDIFLLVTTEEEEEDNSNESSESEQIEEGKSSQLSFRKSEKSMRKRLGTISEENLSELFHSSYQGFAIISDFIFLMKSFNDNIGLRIFNRYRKALSGLDYPPQPFKSNDIKNKFKNKIKAINDSQKFGEIIPIKTGKIENLAPFKFDKTHNSPTESPHQEFSPDEFLEQLLEGIKN